MERWNLKDLFKQVSIRGARFQVDGQLIGNQGMEFDAVIMCEIPINVYYSAPYDPDNPSPPDCWSLGGLGPDIRATHAQSESCVICKQNRFGSATGKENSRGKACRNGRRLVLWMEGIELPVLLGLPPTSIKEFNKYLRTLAQNDLPAIAVVTTFSFDPSKQYPRPVMDTKVVLPPREYLKLCEIRLERKWTDALNAYASVESREYCVMPDEKNEEAWPEGESAS